MTLVFFTNLATQPTILMGEFGMQIFQPNILDLAFDICNKLFYAMTDNAPADGNKAKKIKILSL